MGVREDSTRISICETGPTRFPSGESVAKKGVTMVDPYIQAETVINVFLESPLDYVLHRKKNIPPLHN